MKRAHPFGGLALAALGLAIGSLHASAEAPAPDPLDVLIEGGRVLVGRELTSLNVGVRGERIAYVGSDSPAAKRTISAQGLVVAPGFIDTNTVGAPDRTGELLKLRDGTTTYLSAHGTPDRLFRRPGCLNRAFTFSAPPSRDRRFGDRQMSQIVSALQRGYYGVALSPEYRPTDLTPERVERICREFGARGALISFHARYSSRDRELEGVDEAIRCAEHGAHVQILHLNSTGGAFQPRRAVARIQKAREAGRRVDFDFYPFTYWKSGIAWTRFDGDWRTRYEVSYAQVAWATDPSRSLDAAAFAEIRAAHPRSFVFVESIPRATIDYLALETNAPIGTDTNPYSPRSHPRGVASYATFFRDYVKTGRVPVEDALYRFSGAVAKRFGDVVPGLRERGRIEVGAKADLIVLDLEKFTPRATRQDALAPSGGVHSALVGGVPLLLEARAHTASCGGAAELLSGSLRKR